MSAARSIAALLATGHLRVPERRRRRVALPARVDPHVHATASRARAASVGAKERA